MIIRNSIAAGQFYPRSSSDIESMMDKFFRRADVEGKTMIGGVAPHAGYMYCGETQAYVYKSLSEKFTTFVIIGPNHTGRGSEGAVMTSGIWKTPLGACRIDTDLAEAIVRNSDFLESDYNAHNQEHSIEVQLPWLQYKYSSVRFVPISMSGRSLKDAKDIGDAIKVAGDETEENFAVIASSDFTHYGMSYGYTPVTGGVSKILNYIEKVDREAASAVENLSPETFMDIVDRYNATICGAGPIAALLYYMQDKAKGGKLLDYSTSYDISKNKNSIVGYCGLGIQ